MARQQAAKGKGSASAALDDGGPPVIRRPLWNVIRDAIWKVSGLLLLICDVALRSSQNAQAAMQGCRLHRVGYHRNVLLP